jgi:hypothetical protein
MDLISSNLGHVLPAVEVAEDHGHQEFWSPYPGRELAPILRPALKAIEVHCCDALPMAGTTRDYPSWVWEHFE